MSYFKDKEKLFEVSAEGTKDECFNEIQSVMKKLKLHKFKKLKEMRDYLSQKIDVYIKPLVVYLMKNEPEDVLGAI